MGPSLIEAPLVVANLVAILVSTPLLFCHFSDIAYSDYCIFIQYIVSTFLQATIFLDLSKFLTIPGSQLFYR